MLPPRNPLLGNLVNRYLFTVLVLTLKLHIFVHEGESVSSFPLPTLVPGGFSFALPDKDVAGQNKLTVGPFGSETLRLTFAAFLVEPIPFLCAML